GDRFGRRLGDGHAELIELRRAPDGPIPGRDRAPGPGQVRRHRRAHGPEAEERDGDAVGSHGGQFATVTVTAGVVSVRPSLSCMRMATVWLPLDLVAGAPLVPDRR